jgi:hypothetical protein
MGIQRHLDLTFVCPLSGVELEGLTIPLHRMAVLQCENGALFASCPNHVVRCFISDFTTVRQVMASAVVLSVTDRKPRKKERTNGQT